MKPRAWVHRGTVAAAALLVSRTILGEARARRRVIALWDDEARVFARPDGYLVQWPVPRMLRAEDAPGAPWVLRGATLASAPLADDELVAGEALEVRAGRVVGIDRLEPIDPADWLALDLAVVEVEPLGGVQEAPVVAEPPAEDVRRVLALPAPAPERAAFFGPSTPRRAVVAQRLAATMALLLRPLLRLLAGRLAGGPGPRRAGGDAGDRAGVGAEASPRPEGAASPWWRRLAEVALAWLARTPLLALMSRRQAEYLARTMAMFERGDLDQALRHAIPLSSLPGKGQRPALGVPRPRDEVRLVPSPQAEATSTLVLADDLFADLRRLYRRASERLVRDGRIEEAAFVLVDLLDDATAGVELLERHRRFGVAAQIAEARELPGGQIVRLWFLAGRRREAVAAARRYQAFGAAVDRLERARETAEAEALRLIWADHLATSGDLLGAVEAIWPVAPARHLARAWIEAGIAAGGAAAGTLLARKLAFGPEAAAEVEARIRPRLRNPASDARATRRAVALAATSDAVQAARPLARDLCRALLADAAIHGIDRAPFDQLAKLLADPVLAVDAPPWPEPLRPAVPPLHAIDAGDRGLTPIADAAWLGGRWLVALGERGVQLRGADGRVIATFDQPASRLVISENGHRAIGLAWRGRVLRLSRIDLVRRVARPWCDAAVGAWAPRFDGERWYVVIDGRLTEIDAIDEGWRANWRSEAIDGHVHAVAAEGRRVAILTSALEVASYDIGARGPTLRRRRGVEASFEGGEVTGVALAADGALLAAAVDEGGLTLRVDREGLRTRRVLAAEAEVVTTTSVSWAAGAVAVVALAPDHARVWLLEGPAERGLAGLRIEGASAPSVHLTASGPTVFDTAGRLLWIDPESGSIERSLRL